MAEPIQTQREAYVESLDVTPPETPAEGDRDQDLLDQAHTAVDWLATVVGTAPGAVQGPA